MQTTTNCGSATTPAGPLGYDAGGGGGTSYYYTEPYYQDGVVPSALTLRNEAIFGPTPLRVEPDISMDADAQTGILIGLTQTYNAKTKYGQFKEGGTSLASPLLAGVIADTDQEAGASRSASSTRRCTRPTRRLRRPSTTSCRRPSLIRLRWLG